jgi:hypothetical protein
MLVEKFAVTLSPVVGGSGFGSRVCEGKRHTVLAGIDQSVNEMKEPSD